MELEFFDQTRQRTGVNYWDEALLMFRKRLRVYLENQDLLTIKQTDHTEQGREFVEKELRAQRLIDSYCQMCSDAQKNNFAARSKQTFVTLG